VPEISVAVLLAVGTPFVGTKRTVHEYVSIHCWRSSLPGSAASQLAGRLNPLTLAHVTVGTVYL
jgi:hypothetical protein